MAWQDSNRGGYGSGGVYNPYTGDANRFLQGISHGAGGVGTTNSPISARERDKWSLWRARRASNLHRGQGGGAGSTARVVGNRKWDPKRRKWVKLADDPRHRVVGNKRWDPRKRRWVQMKNDPRQRYNNMSGGRGKKWDPKRRKWVSASVYAKQNKAKKANKSRIRQLQKKKKAANSRNARRRYQKKINQRRRRWRR